MAHNWKSVSWKRELKFLQLKLGQEWGKERRKKKETKRNSRVYFFIQSTNFTEHPEYHKTLDVVSIRTWDQSDTSTPNPRETQQMNKQLQYSINKYRMCWGGKTKQLVNPVSMGVDDRVTLEVMQDWVLWTVCPGKQGERRIVSSNHSIYNNTKRTIRKDLSLRGSVWSAESDFLSY